MCNQLQHEYSLFMKFKLLPVNGKTVWQNNKPFIWFLLSLLLIYSVLKIIFYQYNHQLIFNNSENTVTGFKNSGLIKWSLGQDLLTVLSINAVLLFLLTIGRLLSAKFSAWLLIPVFVFINSFAVILNLADVFYFRFHFQRANADLWYVTDHPLNRLMQQNFFIILLFITGTIAIIFLMWVLHKKLLNAFLKGQQARLISLILLTCIMAALIFKNSFSKILVPAYPMVELKSKHLPFVQNSFHTFFYSVYRKGEGTQLKNYMTNAECDSLMPIRKKLNINITDSNKQNIVFFIMESVPNDFFDSSGAYKVSMPFFDSLLQKSIYFNNAFCYAHQSNKAITAILAGIPTVSDIPVYHSQYINMPVTPIGTALKKLNYNSLFCIGDEYDNFGFAKCMNWLGFDKYYSKEDIAGYKKLPAHSMGLQDEYVLDFFLQKIKQQQKPFFAVHYNISTHYPYDIPEKFSARLPANYTAPMKAMRYYDNSLQQFFNAAINEPWYGNTKFIFCSDHWLFPQGKKAIYSDLSAYRIPIIIFDPSINTKKIINSPVSQFDILGTVLAVAGYRDSIISFGDNLLEPVGDDRVVFTKANANLYQAIDSSHILGYNSSNDKAEFLYDYLSDKTLKKNLVNDDFAQPKLKYLTFKVKAFLQKAKMQRSGIGFN